VNDQSSGARKIARGRFGDAIRGTATGASIPSLGEIGLNQFAPYLMNRVAAKWNAELQETLKEYDLNTVKMRSLAVLTVTPGLTINELSLFAVTEQSTMSRTIDAMEEQGLIRRQTREDDLRVREVHLTDEGREAFLRFWPVMYDRFSSLFRGIDEEEYQAFVITLHKLVRNQQQADPR
jgi:MarR family transcriptional regulator for hemolysin